MKSLLRAFVVCEVAALAAAVGPPLTVAPPGADLRSACSAEAETLARLEGGTAIEIRFAVSGELGVCYKVRAGERSGYLLGIEIRGLETFERARRAGAEIEIPQAIRAEVSRLKQEGGPAVAEVLALIETNQPREALGRLESGPLRSAGEDPFVLSLAGLAAYQSDRLQEAVDYWSRSLALKPNPAIETLVQKARRELSADQNRGRLSNGRFVVRFDERQIPREQAAWMLEALGEEFGRIDLALGCGIQEQITAIVETVDAYRAATDAADWSGGQFDGRIRIAVAERSMNAAVRRALAHELVHACLARQGRFPLWFHEGMAQRWSGERSVPAQISAVKARLRAKQMPDLNHLSPAWARMSAEHARLAYAQSLAAVEILYQQFGEQYVRALIRDPEALAETAWRLSDYL